MEVPENLEVAEQLELVALFLGLVALVREQVHQEVEVPMGHWRPKAANLFWILSEAPVRVATEVRARVS